MSAQGGGKPAAAGAKKKPAAAAAAAAARAEVENDGHELPWRGLKLAAPAQLPAAVVWTMAELEDGRKLKPLLQLIAEILGEDQVRAVRTQLTVDLVPFGEAMTVLGDLIADLLGLYGMGPGESEASADS